MIHAIFDADTPSLSSLEFSFFSSMLLGTNFIQEQIREAEGD